MRPIPLGADSPYLPEHFVIEWSSVVRVYKWIRAGDSAYLDAVALYCNNGGFPKGIFGLTLVLRDDPELDRLLAHVHARPTLAAELVPHLLARTTARTALHDFERDPAALETRIRAASFELVDPFVVSGELASYLYHYGMYRHFYDDGSPEDAAELARGLLAQLTSGSLEQLLAFQTRLPWGAWFDEHSCSDRTFVLLDRHERRASVLAFSHSD